MEVSITDRKANLSEEFKGMVRKKLSRMDRVFGENAKGSVIVTSEKNAERVEITIRSGGDVYRTENHSQDVNLSLGNALAAIGRQIRRNKSRLEKRLRTGFIDDILDEGYQGDDEDGAFKIVKTKRFPVKPMSEEEAVLQMNLVGHQFYMFRNQYTNDVNVVYGRKDGTYGLLEPENA